MLFAVYRWTFIRRYNALHQLQPNGPSEASFWDEGEAVVEKNVNCMQLLASMFLQPTLNVLVKDARN